MEDDNRFIRDEAIGEISIKDLEKEAISRTLRFFNTNRRKTAKSLGMSERTLYRKIDEYQLENKSKKIYFESSYFTFYSNITFPVHTIL